MAENITTIYEMYAARDPQDLPEIDDLVPLTSGTGTERDKPATLREIGELLIGGGGLDEIELKKALAGGGYKVVTIDGESMEFSQYGGSSPDGTVTDLSMLGMSVKLTSQGYDTATEVTRDGVVVSFGPTEGAKEKTEVLYNKVRVKTIEGTSAGQGSADAKELVIASGLHISNSGGSQYLKVDGLAEFNGNAYFNGDVVIGNELQEKDVQVYGKVSKAKYVIDSNVMDDSTVNLISPADNAFDVGEVVYVRNTTSADLKVYFGYIGGPAFVYVKPKCTIPFICVSAGRNNWEWSPLCNIDYDVETQSNEG